jgi:nitrite reductase (NADH) large subunit
VGVICVDSGYEIGVAGAAGMDVKETDLLAKAETEDETLDLIMAFTQIYRENAKYLDRPYKWVAKVGLDWVKDRVVDDLENRAALVARFKHSQSIYQTDPWAARADDETTKKWSPMADLTLRAAE